jgi:DNA topoisomerase-3
LACCSEDAIGKKTSVEVEMGGEIFTASGLMVIARNYLDVYTWDRMSGNTIPVSSYIS